MKNNLMFRIFGALASALIIVGVFVPFVSVYGHSETLWDIYSSINTLYLPIMIIVFGFIGVIFFALNIKTEFAYMSTGAVLFFIIMQALDIVDQGMFSSLSIGFYFLATGAILTGIMAFLCNLKVKKKVVQQIDQNNTNQPSLINQIDELYSEQQNQNVVPVVEPEVSQIIPEIEPEVSQMVPEIEPKVSQIVPEIEPKVSQIIPEIEPKVSQIVPEMEPEASQIIPEIEPKVSQIVPEMEPEASQIIPDIQPVREMPHPISNDINFNNVARVNPVLQQFELPQSLDLNSQQGNVTGFSSSIQNNRNETNGILTSQNETLSQNQQTSNVITDIFGQPINK